MLLHDSTPTHPRTPAPPSGPFQLSHLVRDQSHARDEIYFDNADELLRLFSWFDLLVARDGAMELYAPLVDQLRSCARGIEAFASSARLKLSCAPPATET
jgi:hypothetical protein